MFVTDHARLTPLRNKDLIPEEPQPMNIELEQYDYTLIHRPGERHGNADELSRMPQPLESEQSIENCGSIKIFIHTIAFVASGCLLKRSEKLCA